MTRLLIVVVTLYRWTLGLVLPNACNFTPSCSVYAIEALRRRGVVVGSYLAVRRILRCHPWGGHGYDPVACSHPACPHGAGVTSSGRPGTRRVAPKRERPTR